LYGCPFGHSAVPGRSAFSYTFDHLGDVVDGLLEQLAIGKFAIYVMDFGAAVGFRLALRHPQRLSAVILQTAPPDPWDPRGGGALRGRHWADGASEPRHAARLPGPGRAARAAGLAHRRGHPALAAPQ